VKSYKDIIDSSSVDFGETMMTILQCAEAKRVLLNLKGPSSSVLNGFLGLGTAEILCVAISAMIFRVWVKHV
jgi:hypothetical protein